MNTEKLILDPCCGGRQFWFDKSNPDVLFCDVRVMEPKVVGSGKDARVRKCLPDRVMDFRKWECEVGIDLQTIEYYSLDGGMNDNKADTSVQVS